MGLRRSRQTSAKRIVCNGAILLCGLLMHGCGPQLAEVTGSVKLNDQPLPGGTIYFVAANGKGAPQGGTIDENGNYKLKAPIGDCLVYVDNRGLQEGDTGPVGSAGTGPKNLPGTRGGKGPAVGPPPDVLKKMREEKGVPDATGTTRPKGKYVPIPSKYYTTTTSELTYTVKSGQNTYNVELRDK